MKAEWRFLGWIVAGLCLPAFLMGAGEDGGGPRAGDSGGTIAHATAAGETGPVLIAPNPANWRNIGPAKGPEYMARLIWEEKQREADEKPFQWGAAIRQSSILFGISHAYRLADQPYTRAELRGPYIKDWIDSVKGLSGWDDTDSFLANYVAHPFSGAVTSYYQIQNDPRGRLQEFGKSRPYWKSRLKAFGWATAYSTIYELSPVGDAAIGNVGHPVKNPGTKGAVDLVITPTLGISLVILQDMIDAEVVAPFEQRTNSAMAVRILRSLAVPHRAFANLFRLKRPWYVDSRGPAIAPIRYSQLPEHY